MNDISPLMQIHWRPGIGDPTFIGWFTVAAYVAAFIFSLAYMRRLDRTHSEDHAPEGRRLWRLIALILLLLGINKQLDLQTLLTETGRLLAKQQGWYEQRRSVQALFIAVIASGGIYLFLIVWRAYKNVWRENLLPIAGMLFLIAFVVIRAASFHHVDRILGWHPGGFKLNWILELGGIACIMATAIVRLKRCPAPMREKPPEKDIYP